MFNSSTLSTIASDSIRGILAANQPLSDAVLLMYMNRNPVSTDSDFVSVLIPNMPLTGEALPDLMNYIPNLSQPSADTLVGAMGYNPGYRTITAVRRESEQTEILRSGYLDAVVKDFLDSSLVDSAYALLDAENTFASDIALAALYLENEEYELTQTLINNMDYEDVDFENWRDLFQVQLTLAMDNRTLFDMNQDERSLVEGLAGSSDCELSNTQARAIMSLITQQAYDGCDEESGSKPQGSTTVPGKVFQDSPRVVNELFVMIYPNPAQHAAVISYWLPDNCGTSMLSIMSSTGQVIKKITLKNNHEIIPISCSGIVAGFYIVSVSTDHSIINKKLIIK